MRESLSWPLGDLGWGGEHDFWSDEGTGEQPLSILGRGECLGRHD